MPDASLLRRLLLANLPWFVGALVLALLVWIVAIAQSDPFGERPFLNVPVQIIIDDDMLITNSPRRSVRVVVRAQRSVLDLMTADEIVVRANLSGLGPGSHPVELDEAVARRGVSVVDVNPRQIRIALEQIEERLKPVQVVVTGEPPPGFERDEPLLDVAQILVSGTASRVDAVVAAQAEIDLTEQRNPFASDVLLAAHDANGNTVGDVELDPTTVRIDVNIRQRDDVREVPVAPNLLVNTLPEGYILTGIGYEPQVILISGASDELERIANTLFTEPVDLTGQTDDFELVVPVELPESDLLVLSSQNITLTLGIAPLQTSRQFDRIPVELIGVGEGLAATLALEEVTVLMTGPQPLLQNLGPDDIQVVLDANGLGEGNYELAPNITLRQGDTLDATISVLPADIDVQIAALEAVPTR